MKNAAFIDKNLVTLTDSSYNTIAHNRIIRGVADTDAEIDDDPSTEELTDKGISGYNFFVFIEIIGLISLVIIKRGLKRLRH